MDANLREHFGRAVGDDPGDDPGEMARTAIAEGGRVRRRRRQAAAAGVAAVLVLALGAVAGVRLGSAAPGADDPSAPAGPPMTLVAASGCSEKPVERDATDVVIYAGDANGHTNPGMIAELRAALDDDPRVRTVRLVDREQALREFRKLFADQPAFLAQLGLENMLESFRLRLADPSAYAAFRTEYAARGDVASVDGRICPVSAPVGGVEVP